MQSDSSGNNFREILSRSENVENMFRLSRSPQLPVGVIWTPPAQFLEGLGEDQIGAVGLGKNLVLR